MTIRLNEFSGSATSAGLLAVFVGFAGSFAVVVQGLVSVGASPAQAASGLMAAALAVGFGSLFLTWRSGLPVSLAWSTPGAAFLATLAVPEGGFGEAIGAFIVAAALVILAGFWKPLARLVTNIPKPIASAMLAGVLLPLCLAPFQAIAQFPTVGLPVVLTWVVFSRIRRLLAVPAAVLVAIVLIGMQVDLSGAEMRWALSDPVLVTPSFSLASITGIALPLFIITMAAQNVTGIAILANYGFRPDPGQTFRWTGIFSLAAVPFGSPLINLAAITAAICAGPEAHPEPDRRYWSVLVSGLTYLIVALVAGIAVGFLSVAPPILIAAVAGLALLGAMASALMGAMSDPAQQEAALVTFLITASGLSFFGIGGAFWGLLAGGALYVWDRRSQPTS